MAGFIWLAADETVPQTASPEIRHRQGGVYEGMFDISICKKDGGAFISSDCARDRKLPS